MEIFFLFQGLRRLREVAELKYYAAHLEQEGVQELDLAMVITPVSWLVDLVSGEIHEAGRLANPSSSVPFPTVEGQQDPSLGPCPEESQLCFYYHYF